MTYNFDPTSVTNLYLQMLNMSPKLRPKLTRLVQAGGFAVIPQVVGHGRWVSYHYNFIIPQQESDDANPED